MVQGSGCDTSLNFLGHAQARAFYDRYKDVQFDRIYTSTLKRTTESVSLFLEDQVPQLIHAGLNEISWGDKEGRKLTAQDDKQHFKMLADWKRGLLNEKSPGGESPVEVQARQIPIWEFIKAQKNEKNVLICMHGRAMRMFLCLMLGLELKNMDQFEHGNLSMYLLEYNDQTGQTTLILRNDRSHLEGVEINTTLPIHMQTEGRAHLKSFQKKIS
jgi:probable phosphoglycerate mutase